MSDTTLLWFRQDLRLRDNPALKLACESEKVFAIYIDDTVNPKNAATGQASRWWLHHSLQSLNTSLANHLHVQQGDPLEILPKLLKKTGIKKIVWNRCYEPWQIKRDKKLNTLLKSQGIEVESFRANLLWEPWHIYKKDGSPYKVFTPYYRKGCLKTGSPDFPVGIARNIPTVFYNQYNTGIEALKLLPDTHWYGGLEKNWQPGEKGASLKLSTFLGSAASNYQDGRNFPALQGTSRLSPHLHYGEISPNQVWYAALEAFEGNMDHPQLDCFLSELGWREFSCYLLFHFPGLNKQNFNKRFDKFPWEKNQKHLQAWRQGQTGIPIVDAGMRELWQTGYMHNRVRMVVASFLVKNLLIHWREGERWFRDTLVDADLASNSASWQWVAGSGADAAPYFRIFNPVLQGKKFDAKGNYVRLYCPELSQLNNKYIHCPWEADTASLKEAGITLGMNYPKPLVDLKLSRQKALDAFSSME